jgi:hypothetical protein
MDIYYRAKERNPKTVTKHIGMLNFIDSHFYGKSSVKFLSHPRHNCVIDQSATANKVIHTLFIDFFSHGLRSVKI